MDIVNGSTVVTVDVDGYHRDVIVEDVSYETVDGERIAKGIWYKYYGVTEWADMEDVSELSS